MTPSRVVNSCTLMVPITFLLWTGVFIDIGSRPALKPRQLLRRTRYAKFDKGGMQAEGGGRRDAQHEPQAVGGDKANDVNLISQPIGVRADQPGRIVAVRLACPARISFAQPDMAQPRVDVGDGCHLGERLVDHACASLRPAPARRWQSRARLGNEPRPACRVRPPARRPRTLAAAWSSLLRSCGSGKRKWSPDQCTAWVSWSTLSSLRLIAPNCSIARPTGAHAKVL